MCEPFRRRGADAAPLRVEAWVSDVDVLLVLLMQRQAGVVLAQVRFSDEAVRVRADQRHSGVDALHSEAPARERTVDVAAGQVEDRANRVRNAITVKGAQVSGPHDGVQGGAHRTGRQLPLVVAEAVDVVHLAHVIEDGGELVPAAGSVAHVLRGGRWMPRRQKTDAHVVDHGTLVACGVERPRRGVRNGTCVEGGP